MYFIALILALVLLFMTWKNRVSIIQKKGKGMFFTAIAFWCLCILAFFLPTPPKEGDGQAEAPAAPQVAEVQNVAASAQENANQIKEVPVKPKEEKDEPLPANPDESKRLKVHVSFLKKTYGDLTAHYNQQKGHYDEAEWASYTKKIRANLEVKRADFDNQFPIGKVSGGNIENVFSINDLYISLYTEVIKTMWDNLDGSNSDEEVKSIVDKTDQTFKKIKFQ